MSNDDDPLKQLQQQQGDDFTNWLKQQYENFVNSPGFKNDQWPWEGLGPFFQSKGFHEFVFGTDEEQLAHQIADKVAPGQWGSNPRVEQLARAAAHRAYTDPNYRLEIARQLGWNTNNPHVQYWLQHGGGLPSDPTGTGTTGGAAKTGTGTSGGAAATTGATASPFDASKWVGRSKDPGFTYGALLPPSIAAAAGVDRQWGVDYALPLGTDLNSPFAGTVIQAGWNGPYGNTVVVRMANGVTYRVAHLQDLNVKVGQTVGVGAMLGTVGSTGNSTGPHVLIEMRDPQGKPIDPTPIIDELLKPGADLSATGGAYQKITDLNNMVAGEAGPFLTPDGHWIYPGSQDYNVYAAAQSLWKKRYGGDPPWSFVSGLIGAGNTTAEQIQAAMDAMPSDITGMDWGSRDTFANSANNAASKLWNRSVPDSTLKQLAALGIKTPQQVQDWFGSHPAAALDAQTYGTYFDAANPHTQKVWQQPPSPDLINEIHKQMQQGPTG